MNPNELTALKLKWWQYLIVAVTVIGIDIAAHVPALGFDSSVGAEVSAVAIPIASAALLAMGIVPGAANAKEAIKTVQATVSKIDAQTNGVLDERIKQATSAALKEYGVILAEPIVKSILADVTTELKPGA